MKLYVVALSIVLALLFISAGCQGADQDCAWEATLFARTCSDPKNRLKLYKDVAECTITGSTVEVMDQDSQKKYAPYPRAFFVTWKLEVTKEISNIGKDRTEKLLIYYGHLPLQKVAPLGMQLFTTQQNGTTITTWNDTFKKGLFSDEIVPGKKDELVVPIESAATIAVQPAARVPQVAHTSVPTFFTAKRLVVGTLLAGAALVYRYREPIKQTLAKLAQSAQKVKVLAH